MASGAYNGWSGLTRDYRGTIFYNKGFAKVKKGDTCNLCGQPHGPVSLSFHAEEYGPTWDEYVAQCQRLCPRCHGMIHTRFRFPNRWERYKHKVREENYGGFMQFATLRDFFGFVKKVPDIEPHPIIPTGIEWLDNLSLTPYNGMPKLATVILSDGIEILDANCYPEGTTKVQGVIYRNGGKTIRTLSV